MKRQELEMIFNPDFEILTITCRSEDEEDVADRFHACLEKIEEDVEANEEEEIYDEDDVLLVRPTVLYCYSVSNVL